MLNSEIKKEVLKDVQIGDVIYIKRAIDRITTTHLCILPKENKNYMLKGIFFNSNNPKGVISDINITNISNIKIINFENITKLKRNGIINEVEYDNIINLFLKDGLEKKMLVELLSKICKNYEI
jgi:hypothetical protein